MFHHHATVSGLTQHTKFFYKVGSKSSTAYTSAVYSFVSARAASDNSTFKMVVYGDFGPGDQSKPTLAYVNTLTSDKVDLIYHIGDAGYADDAWLMPGHALGFFYEKVYNQWMNSVTPVMSSVPYMVLVGNHEAECHSPACQTSPTKVTTLVSRCCPRTLNIWYSFEHGPIHFTSIWAVTDYPNARQKQTYSLQSQREFRESVGLGRGRSEEGGGEPCHMFPGSLSACAVQFLRLVKCQERSSSGTQAAFEALFLKYKVDIVLTAHEHFYQRHTPIRNNQPVLDGVSSDRKTFNIPQALVYILSGVGGGVEGHETKQHDLECSLKPR